MKTVLASLLTGVACAAVAAVLVSKSLSERHRADLARAHESWAAERLALENALKKAKGRTVVVEMPPAATPAKPAAPTVVASAKPDPREIIRRLQEFRVAAGAQGQSQAGLPPRMVKRLLHGFASLTDIGPAAIPAIREFLARNLDLDYQTGALKGSRDGVVPTDFLVPPSLRFGLFDSLKQIGGADAETALVDVLRATARGLEVAYLARVLQEMAPNKHRDVALSSAKELLANPVPEAAALDRNDRIYLYGVLSFFNDPSYAPVAQGQLLGSDGKLDRAALVYLHKSLGDQAVPIVAQAYLDPRVTDAASKEPLARVALAHVGTNPQAEQMFGKAVRDPALQGDPIRNLVEDLNQDGFANRKVLTPEDRRIADFRLGLTQAYLQQTWVQNDKTLSRAFAEANKDLAKMLERPAGGNRPPNFKPVAP